MAKLLAKNQTFFWQIERSYLFLSILRKAMVAAFSYQNYLNIINEISDFRTWTMYSTIKSNIDFTGLLFHFRETVRTFKCVSFVVLVKNFNFSLKT